MDSSYCWQCQQVGLPPHSLLLRCFTNFERAPGPVLLLGGDRGTDPPVRDTDLVSSCLVLRSLARTAGPVVRLELSGELITCRGARTIAAVLQVSSNLRSLLLRRTHVADEGAAALGAVLGSCMLMELDLGECAITDTGLRYLVRGSQVHGPSPKLSALYLDGNATGDHGTIEVISFIETKALQRLSIQPALPRFLSQEVEAALQVACELNAVALERKGKPLPLDALAKPMDPPAAPTRVEPKPLPDVRHSAHLASWMAGTERELREVKWLLSSSTARLDGQHRLGRKEKGERCSQEAHVGAGEAPSADGDLDERPFRAR